MVAAALLLVGAVALCLLLRRHRKDTRHRRMGPQAIPPFGSPRQRAAVQAYLLRQYEQDKTQDQKRRGA